MTDDIEERAALARRGVMDHSDCEECTEDWTFLMRQGRREFPLGLRTVLACLAFAEREGAVPELPADWWVRINRRYRRRRCAARGADYGCVQGMAGKGGKHRDQPGVIHEVHRRRGPVAS